MENKAGCDFIKQNILGYFEKTLPENSQKEFLDHLHCCPACTKLVSDFQGVYTEMEAKRTVSVNPFIHTRILQGVESGSAGDKTSFFRRIAVPVTITLLMLVAVFTGFSLAFLSEKKINDQLYHQSKIEMMKSEFDIQDFVDETDVL